MHLSFNWPHIGARDRRSAAARRQIHAIVSRKSMPKTAPAALPRRTNRKRFRILERAGQRLRMSSVASVLLRGAIWNIGAFLVGQGLRFATNVVLARLLSPSLFGIMMIVTTFKMGIETDLRHRTRTKYRQQRELGQPEVLQHDFHVPGDPRWTALAGAKRRRAVHRHDLQNAGIAVDHSQLPAAGSFIAALRLRRAIFCESGCVFGNSASWRSPFPASASLTLIALALIWPTVWSLVIGGVFASVFATCASYFLGAGLRLRLQIHREFTPEILHFGKWIFLSTLAYFLSTYCDRLFFAKAVPLSVFGVYGIARSISDLIGMLALRLGGNVLFPYIASTSNTSRETLRQKLAPVRWRFIAVSALGVAVLAVGSDLLIRVLYDRRYHEATWLLPVLVLGSWFSILAVANESSFAGTWQAVLRSFFERRQTALSVRWPADEFRFRWIVGRHDCRRCGRCAEDFGPSNRPTTRTDFIRSPGCRGDLGDACTGRCARSRALELRFRHFVRHPAVAAAGPVRGSALIYSWVR